MAHNDAEMGSGLDEEEALSDFEEDEFEAAPLELVPTAIVTPSIAENLKSALAELEKERQGRKAAEAANVEADSQIKRLKTFVHETIRQRDEAVKSKDDRTRQLEEVLQSKDEITRHRDEIVLQRDDLIRQKDEVLRARDASKTEIAEVARILVTQAEKIMSIANGGKPFSGGLPRFPKATGLSAVALGFGKRMEEVVEEVVRQREEAVKRRNEIHNQMEQRNFSIAIEVSQLEASITQLKSEVGEKSLELERSQKQASEAEHTLREQLGKTKQEAEVLKRRVEEVERQLLLVNNCISQSVQYVAKARDSLLNVLQLMPSEISPEDSVIEEGGVEQDVLASVQALAELAGRVDSSWKQHQEALVKQKEDWESNVKILQEEKDSLVSRMIHLENGDWAIGESELQSNTGDIGLRELSEASGHLERQESGEGNVGASSRESEAANESVSSNQDNSDLTTSDDYTDEHKMNGEAPQQPSVEILQGELAGFEKRYDHVVSKNSALEEELRLLKKEIQRTATAARAEVDKLQLAIANKARELEANTAYIHELEKDAKEHIQTYTNELIAAEEEVARWKDAATAEADAGAAVLEELEKRNKEIETLNERITELKEMVEEANSKVSSKEQMALAAIAARTAAERSLQIADERSSDLRHRVDDMTRALEELDQGHEFRVQGLLDMCWPWLRGRGRPGVNAAGPQQIRGSAEMETLVEPWLR